MDYSIFLTPKMAITTIAAMMSPQKIIIQILRGKRKKRRQFSINTAFSQLLSTLDSDNDPRHPLDEGESRRKRLTNLFRTIAGFSFILACPVLSTPCAHFSLDPYSHKLI